MTIEFQLNGEAMSLDVPEDTPLLWAIRDHAGLTGTKFGCGIGMCGACTVHLNGRATRSCITPVGSVSGQQITTIEGLGQDGEHPLQQAWWMPRHPSAVTASPGRSCRQPPCCRISPTPPMSRSIRS